MLLHVYIHHIPLEMMDQNGLVEILLPNDEFSKALCEGQSSLFVIGFNLTGKVRRRETQ